MPAWWPHATIQGRHCRTLRDNLPIVHKVLLAIIWLIYEQCYTEERSRRPAEIARWRRYPACGPSSTIRPSCKVGSAVLSGVGPGLSGVWRRCCFGPRRTESMAYTTEQVSTIGTNPS